MDAHWNKKLGVTNQIQSCNGKSSNKFYLHPALQVSHSTSLTKGMLKRESGYNSCLKYGNEVNC